MDNDLLRDLFSHVMAACQILNTDATFSVTCSNLMAQLPPDQIGASAKGQLQEWLQDYEDSGHRHCSHLVGFFPGDEISTFYTPALAAAAKRSIDLRGYNSTPDWSSAWRINLRDRLQDGDGAWTNLLYLYKSGTVATNLVYSYLPNRQMDCTFGRLSGIACMFLQSPRGEVILLPALPTQLDHGMVSGLCAAGGFEVDNMKWTNGQFTGATILSKAGNVCNLRSKWPIIVKQGSNVVSAPMLLPGLYQFATTAGSNYTILPATIAEAENLSATTSGGSQQIITNAAMSNWRAAQFNATAVGNSVTYLVTNVTSGTYHIYITANAGTNCGKFQLACGTNGGAFTDVGPVQDTYSPTNVAYLLPIKLTPTSTNLIVLWTNMQKEFDCGNWTATNNGNYNFRLTVTGTNINSSGYELTPDYIKFVPATVVPANNPPLTPTDLVPASGATGLPVAPMLQGSAFSDPDNGDTQAASQWLVQRLPDNAIVFDSGTDTVDKTSLALPPNTLNFGTSYNWQARYQDNHGAWSGYSAATTFTTIVPALGNSMQPGGLVFSWPANSGGFVLECATNLSSTNWVPVAPPPVIVNGSYNVTNIPSAGNMFFRLDKP
jgi:hypothetical protein